MSSTHLRYQRTTVFDVLDARGQKYTWLADQLGCSRSLLSKIKAGKTPIPIWFPERVSAVLGLPVSTLFFEPLLHSCSDSVPNSSEVNDVAA